MSYSPKFPQSGAAPFPSGLITSTTTPPLSADAIVEPSFDSGSPIFARRGDGNRGEKRRNGLDDAIGAVEDWIVEGLPAWNNKMLTRAATSKAFARELTTVLKPILEIHMLDLARADRDPARKALGMIAFCACSIERETQTTDDLAPGEGVKMVPGLAGAMTALAVPAEMPPNLSAAGYWTDNAKVQWISFTGDAQERFFRDMVGEICNEHAAAIEALRIALQMQMRSPAAAHMIREATATQVAVKRNYARFRNTAKREKFEMTISFFKDTMRTFLVAFPVNGVMWQSANAANVVEQAMLDFVIGIVDDEYVAHVQERMRYMSPQEREAMLEVMRAPSVLDRILDAIALSEETVSSMASEDLVDHLHRYPEMRTTLQAFRAFKEAAAAASGAHFGLIVEYLVKSEEGSTTKRAVDAGHGTGGRTHEETKRVQEMRARHPIADKLCTAVKTAWTADTSAEAGA